MLAYLNDDYDRKDDQLTKQFTKYIDIHTYKSKDIIEIFKKLDTESKKKILDLLRTNDIDIHNIDPKEMDIFVYLLAHGPLILRSSISKSTGLNF